MTNCPNCGAPIEPYKIRCEYCGSYYFDFAAFDCDTDKPVYIKFKVNQFGQEAVITALAKPSLETIELSSDPVYATDAWGNNLLAFASERRCEMVARFRCLENNGTLLKVEEI